MSIGVIGQKTGMTRVFTEAGVSIPVTVIEVQPNRISQVKTADVDGYEAVQLTTGVRRNSRVTKAQAGHFGKAGVEAGRTIKEFRVASAEYAAGGDVKVDVFSQGQLVDVTGVSKGKGFAGGIKRWNFTAQDNTHGNSVSHRHIGSTGQNQTPGRVFKGKKMPGQMGNKRNTVQNLEVVRVDVEKNILLVKGAVPGAIGADLVIRSAVKAKA